MDDPRNEEIAKLKAMLRELESKNSTLYYELRELKVRLDQLAESAPSPEVELPDAMLIITPEPVEAVAETVPAVEAIPTPAPKPEIPVPPKPKAAESKPKESRTKREWEQFIGENLINKIGILITIIGVGIGSKYAIDHQLISPEMRIILGYLLGTGLLVLAIRLKAKYHDFSAVLLSGAMTIFYFLTFISYVMYHFIPLEICFVLMVVFTVFTVFAAIKYDRPIIAHLGLVGAYAVPFLLSDGSGKIGFFFSYLVLVNVGILIISFLRNWKSLYFVSFGLTWGIYLIWFAMGYREEKHFALALLFLFLFFSIFYVTSLAYKLLNKVNLVEGDVVLILINSFAFFGLGMTMLGNHGGYDSYLGLFCIFNAVVHFAVSVLLYRSKLVNKALFFLTASMVLLFLTITVPIELDGNAITLVWASEALMLFLIARLKKIPLFETMSFPILILGFFSLVFLWMDTYMHLGFFEQLGHLGFLKNSTFLTSIYYLGTLVCMYVFNSKKQDFEAYPIKKDFFNVSRGFATIFLILTGYFCFLLEINQAWNELYYGTDVTNRHLVESLKVISIIAFSLVYVGGINFHRANRTNKDEYNAFTYIISILALFSFLSFGLYRLNSLQFFYLFGHENDVLNGAGLVLIRYAMYAVVAAYFYVLIRFIKGQFKEKIAFVYQDMAMHILLVWVLSAELVNWMLVFDSHQIYKLGLSILWGVYSLGLVVLGIWKKKSYLRIGAFFLFGITLVKLFFYDIAHMSTLVKTIVFLALGIILLIISFLYNKYKVKLSEEDDKK